MSTENHPPVKISFLPLLKDFRCKGMKYILLTIKLLYTKTRPFRFGNSRVKTAAKAYLQRCFLKGRIRSEELLKHIAVPRRLSLIFS